MNIGTKQIGIKKLAGSGNRPEGNRDKDVYNEDFVF